MLLEQFKCFKLGSLSLLENVKVPLFLSFLFDGVFISDFTHFSCFMKINQQWYKVLNLIVPFLFARKETCDEMSCRCGVCYQLFLDCFCCCRNLSSFNDYGIFLLVGFVRCNIVFREGFTYCDSVFHIGVKSNFKKYEVKLIHNFSLGGVMFFLVVF